MAADDYPYKKEIEARQAVMRIYAFNLGLLGAMAKGEAEYDAKLATAAANNLLATTNMDNSAMWPPGSDADADGLAGENPRQSRHLVDLPGGQRKTSGVDRGADRDGGRGRQRAGRSENQYGRPSVKAARVVMNPSGCRKTKTMTRRAAARRPRISMRRTP